MSANRIMLLNISEWERTTYFFSLEELGTAIRLMMHLHVEGGSVPDDDRAAARALNVSTRCWRRVRPLIAEVFEVHDGRVYPAAGLIKLGRVINPEGRPAIASAVRETVWQRDGEECRYCGSTEGPFHLDHVLPWSRGGAHTVENLVVSCRACNLTKRDRTPDEMGWAL